MKLCVVSYKPCWQDRTGRWLADGGFPIQMAALSAHFEATEVLVVRTRPRAGGIPLPDRVRVVPLPAPRGSDLRRKASVLFRLPYYLLKIGRHVAGADVVHVPLPGDMPALGFFLAVLLRRRLIARYCGSWANNSQSTAAGRLLKSAMRRLAGGRNVMFATGEFDGAKPARVNAVFATSLTQSELDGIRPRYGRELGDEIRLVYMGRLSVEKGIDVLIRAVALLEQRTGSPRVRLAIAGDGPERERLTTLVRQLKWPDRVRFTGQLDRRALSALLEECDLCVQPSLTEGFSKAWLDAMAHGVPVLSSRVGAAAHVIGGDGIRGWLVPPGDGEALAAQLHRAASYAGDWNALRRRCRVYAESRTAEAWAATIWGVCAEQWGVAATCA
jgi:glycosyltransferase involved in cell wall biosynthesis